MSQTPPEETPAEVVEAAVPEPVLGDAPEVAGSPWLLVDDQEQGQGVDEAPEAAPDPDHEDEES